MPSWINERFALVAIFVYSLARGEETEHYKIKQSIIQKSPLFDLCWYSLKFRFLEHNILSSGSKYLFLCASLEAVMWMTLYITVSSLFFLGIGEYIWLETFYRLRFCFWPNDFETGGLFAINLLRKWIFGLSIGLFGGEYSAWLSAL